MMITSFLNFTRGYLDPFSTSVVKKLEIVQIIMSYISRLSGLFFLFMNECAESSHKTLAVDVNGLQSD